MCCVILTRYTLLGKLHRVDVLCHSYPVHITGYGTYREKRWNKSKSNGELFMEVAGYETPKQLISHHNVTE